MARPTALHDDAGGALVVPGCWRAEAEIGIELAACAEPGILEALEPLDARRAEDGQGGGGPTRALGIATERPVRETDVDQKASTAAEADLAAGCGAPGRSANAWVAINAEFPSGKLSFGTS